MERFARIILGYHGAKAGAAAEFARRLLLGEVRVDEWSPSENEYDWLGNGIYFWEHSPERARRWAGVDGIVSQVHLSPNGFVRIDSATDTEDNVGNLPEFMESNSRA